jgi:hypothetical protein
LKYQELGAEKRNHKEEHSNTSLEQQELGKNIKNASLEIIKNTSVEK